MKIFAAATVISVLEIVLLGITCYASSSSLTIEQIITANLTDFGNSTRMSRELKSEKEGQKDTIASCKAIATCYGDSDCPGGRCLGFAVGTCNCAACVQFLHCKTDKDCGGLRGACTDQNFCNCDRAYRYVGFLGALDVMAKICNRKECIQNTTSCFGLPCNSGICSCPIQSQLPEIQISQSPELNFPETDFLNL
uniref:Chondroitin proteoglycan 3 n=1 Tax=Setaria digitata TaxID=48799 RepID=A0A915PIG6_9BILA